VNSQPLENNINNTSLVLFFYYQTIGKGDTT